MLQGDIVRIGHNKIKYSKGIYDQNGYADATKHLPIPFDVCKLIFKDGKVKMGWWTGYSWDGLKLSQDDKVVKWKRIEHA